MALEDQLEPTKALLIVKEDARGNVISDLGNGNQLIRPEIAGDRQRIRSGVVLKKGPQGTYNPGTRVLFKAYAGTEVSAGSSVIFINSCDVDGYLIGEVGEKDDESEPSEDWERFIMPPRGELLVRRSEKPLLYGRIHLPPSASHLATRCMEAEVVATDPLDEKMAEDFPVGSHVLLSPDVCRTIQFDVRGEHLLSRLDPDQIMAHIKGDPTEVPIEITRDYTGVAEDLQGYGDIDERFDEGDPAGPLGVPKYVEA
jgi:hypothetical protein